ncbi:MAG: response regulator transcription factor [Clostridium sp.]|nr:response regulator transcription factor [Clostridium sp.]
MTKGKILVVDDEEHILELIKYNLNAIGYEVIEANNGDDAVIKAINKVPDLILLDLMLPGKDGYDVCRELRSNAKTEAIPIIMLTAKSEEIDKILGLEIGADDYITKPFSVRELMARVKAVLRRYTKSEEGSEKFVFGDIKADFKNYSVTCGDEKVELTLKEFELLEVLVKNRGKILTREMLLDKIWGYEYIGESRTVDVHIRHLRKKVEKDDKNPKFIETIRGVGYRFNPHL